MVFSIRIPSRKLSVSCFLLRTAKGRHPLGYCEAITAVQQSMNRYDPSVIGYEWDDTNPRIQLEPRGGRGYIELKAVRPVK